MVPNKGSFVEGVAVHLSPQEVELLDPFEGYPVMYNRETVLLTLHKFDQE